MSNSESPFRRLRDRGLQSDLAIRAFYALNFLLVFILWGQRWAIASNLQLGEPVWTVFWLTQDNMIWWGRAFLILHLVTAMGAAAFPGFFAARLAAFAGLMMISAVMNSDLAGWELLLHHTYSSVLLAFLFLFFPGRGTRARAAAWRKNALVRLAQITLLSAYVAAGIWRVRQSVVQWLSDSPNVLDGAAFSSYLEVLGRATGPAWPLNAFLLEHRALTGPFMLAATVFELASLIPIFYSGAMRIYGVMLILFRVSIALTFSITFDDHVAMMLLFLVVLPSAQNKNPGSRPGFPKSFWNSLFTSSAR